ncbi:hypothetical protein DPPLL_25900 [Desulfofustis limnaeus]|uniref:Transposase n=1 Tax=Desulfofustis limnaeus TaxID=2740163 RepID=A0ABN6M7J8_9BACT|nr:hypothetical protein DPPLL_25900 [Desulfofustis limnaeus]
MKEKPYTSDITKHMKNKDMYRNLKKLTRVHEKPYTFTITILHEKREKLLNYMQSHN